MKPVIFLDIDGVLHVAGDPPWTLNAHLAEAYPDKGWARSQSPVWAVLEQLGGEVVVVRPTDTGGSHGED